MDKLMISMLTKVLASQKQRSAQEDRMLELLSRDENYISPKIFPKFCNGTERSSYESE